MEPISDDYSFCTHCGKNKNHIAPTHQLLPGTVLQNRYLIGAALGEGGFGITYIGRDLNLDMIIAIKEYFPNGYVSRSNKLSSTIDQPTTTDRKEFFEKGCEKFLQEARVLAKFSSEPGIVNVRDFFEANNTAYIVMEYLKGETLKEHLKRRKRLEPSEVLSILMPVMASLKKVHAEGLIHRDISPDNIMLIKGGAKLLDFGAARDVSEMGNKSLSIMLKPGYAPAEQYRTHGEQGPWTDIYALCATIYKCITGITPDDSIDRNFNDTLKSPSSLGVAINPAVEAAILYGLSIDHRNRYQNIDELIKGFNGAPVTPKSNSEGTVVIPKGQPNARPVGNGAPNNIYNQPGAPNYGAFKQPQAAQQPVQQPARPPVQQPVQQPAQQPVRPPVQQPVQQPQPVYRPQPMPVAPQPVVSIRSVNRTAFAQQPTAINHSAGNIWAPIVYCVLALLCAFISATAFNWICAGTAFTLCIFSAISLQVKNVPVLAKIARWISFTWLAVIPLIALFCPFEIFEYQEPIIDITEFFSLESASVILQIVFICQIVFAFAGVGAYFKRCLQGTTAITGLKTSTVTAAIVGLLFITLACSHFIPLVNYFLFEKTMIIQPIGFFLVWIVPVLHILLPEKHLPNAIWITLKIFAIILVVFFGIILFDCVICMITDESIINAADYSMLWNAFDSLERNLEEATYVPYFYQVIASLIIEFLYFTAMIFNIDLTSSNIFKKSR